MELLAGDHVGTTRTARGQTICTSALGRTAPKPDLTSRDSYSYVLGVKCVKCAANSVILRYTRPSAT